MHYYPKNEFFSGFCHVNKNVLEICILLNIMLVNVQYNLVFLLKYHIASFNVNALIKFV